MPKTFRCLILTALCSGSFAAAVFAEDIPAENTLTCASPIAKGDTAKMLLERFKGDAVLEELPGAEGEVIKGVALYPNDPDRRLNVYFFDDALTDLATVQPDYEATGWTVGGLTVGMNLAELRQINGADMTMTGFEWDYGGYVTSFESGALENIEGGCRLSVRLDPTADIEIPMALVGDLTFSTTAEGLDAIKPVVSSLALTWAAKE